MYPCPKAEKTRESGRNQEQVSVFQEATTASEPRLGLHCDGALFAPRVGPKPRKAAPLLRQFAELDPSPKRSQAEARSRHRKRVRIELVW